MAELGIRISALSKRYGEGASAVDALKNVNMQVAPGEVVGLIGPSGSGKSTLLKCLGAVIEPTAGRMQLGEQTIYDNGWQLSDLRALRREIAEPSAPAGDPIAAAELVEPGDVYRLAGDARPVRMLPS